MKSGDVTAGRAAIRGRFSAEELGILWALRIQDHAISLEQGEDERQMAVLRPFSAPDSIAATLSKGAGGICLLTSYRVLGSGAEPDLEAAFPSFAMAVFALGAVFSPARRS